MTDAAQAIADAFETAGNRAQDAADARGSAVLRWLGGLASGAGDVVGAAVVGIGTLGAGARAAGLVGLLSGVAGAALVLAGKLLALAQAMTLAEVRKRALTSREICLLKKVFHDSLSIYDIRLVVGRAGLFDVNDRPFTLANTIYMKSTPAGDWDAILVHEATHVWQYQHMGSRYASDALAAQARLGAAAYDWRLCRPKAWKDFNLEAQAEALADAWRAGAAPQGDLAPVAAEALATVRGAANARPSVRILRDFACGD
jgi:hypothetical protein